MRAALVRVDVVREREERLLVGVVPLEGDLDLAGLARVLDVDDLVVERRARALAVQVLHEVDDAAVVLEGRLEALAALVAEADLEAPGEERHLAEALLERRAVVLDRLEDLQVREERDARAAPVGRLAARELRDRRATLVRLLVLVAVTPDGQVKPLGQRVHHRDADAVQSAGDLVAAAVAELAAGVEDREHDLGCRPALLLVHLHGDAAAVVGDRDAVVRVDRDLDLGGLARERLVDRVVHHLVDQMVQPALARRADVHARPLAHGLEALQDRDVLGAVGAVRSAVLLLGLLRQGVPSISGRASGTHLGGRGRAQFARKSPDARSPVRSHRGGT